VNGNGERPVVCPRNPVWLQKMLDILPPGLRGKLTPFADCIEAEKPKEGAKVIRPAVKH